MITPCLRCRALVAALFFVPLTDARAANPFLHHLFTNDMVLQRDAVDPIWGWTTPGNQVTVEVNDEKDATVQTKSGTADAGGRWQVDLDPIAKVANNAAYSLVVSAPNETTTTLTNVLIGDVILCSGQSNMEYTLWAPNFGFAVADYEAETADAANHPLVRLYHTPRTAAATPQEIVPKAGPWKVSGTSTVNGISAVGYFMARELSKRNDVPIGVLHSTWLGTPIGYWVSKEIAEKEPELFQGLFELSATPRDSAVTACFNGQIHPLAPFRIRAVAWYQGEGNMARGESYARILPQMIAAWRKLFAQPDLPFFVIQLANCEAPATTPVETAPHFMEVREAQLKTVLADPNARLITTIDIGGPIEGPILTRPGVHTTIDTGSTAPLHPRNKQDVGKRLCLAAEDLLYKKKNAVGQGPLFTEASCSGGSVRCTFNNVGAGLMVGHKDHKTPLSPAQPVAGGSLTGFALAAADGLFHAATAAITGTNEVTVTCPAVPNPVTVRYAWARNPACNLYNTIVDATGKVIDGLPASPFRSDASARLEVSPQLPGSAFLAPGAVTSITAPAFPGLRFHHWSGDTACLSSATSATTNVTMSQNFVSIFGNYEVVGAPADLAAVLRGNQVFLTWNSMKHVLCSIKRGTSPDGPFTTVIPRVHPLIYSGTDSSGVTEGTTYFYVITAESVTGEGPISTPVSITIPKVVHDLEAAGDDAHATLSWTAFDGGVDHYRIKRAIASGGPYVPIATSTSSSYTDRRLIAGATYHYVVSAVSGTAETPDSALASFTPNFAPVPEGVVDQDIGNVVLTGSAHLGRSGTCTVIGAGADIGGTSDAFHFFHQELAGDGSLTARVASIGKTDNLAKAGVMMRASTNPDAPFAFSFVPSFAHCGFSARLSDGATAQAPTTSGVGPKWVRIVRSGNEFSGYVSADGATWTQMGKTQTIDMPRTIRMGLAVTSRKTDQLNTALFDNVIGWRIPPPGTPSGLEATMKGDGVRLTWNAASKAASYSVKRATTSGGPYTTVTSGINAISHDCSGLTAGSVSYYVVSAVNAGGESANSPETVVDLSALPRSPRPPTGVHATAGNGHVTLSWDASAIAARYVVKRSAASGGPYAEVATTGSSTFTDTGLTNASTYHYVVAAVQEASESRDSAQVAATPQVTVTGAVIDSRVSRKYITDTGTSLNAGKTNVGPAELFSLVTLSGSTPAGTPVAFQSLTSGLFVSAPDATTPLKASTRSIGAAETFTMTKTQTLYVYDSQSGLHTLRSQGTGSFVKLDRANNLIADNPLGQRFWISGTNVVQVTTGLTAESGDGTVRLDWAPATGAARYSVKRAATSGGPYTEIGTTSDTTYTDTTASNGTTFYYVVSGLNLNFFAGGPLSSEVSATPYAP